MQFMNGCCTRRVFKRGYYFRVIFLLIVFAVSISGQSETGSISGTVKDPNGDAIAGAVVSVKSVSDGVKKSALSGADGSFLFSDMNTGNYRLSISAKSFKTIEKAVRVDTGGTATVVASLKIDENRVTVTAEIGVVNSVDDIPQSVSVITSEELRERGDSVLSRVAETEIGLNVQATSPTIGAIVVRGMTGKNVVNYIDGVRYTNSGQRGGINTFFNLNDASNLRSMEVLRGPNGAQYGSDSLGGTVNLITKSPAFGSPQRNLHGEFYSGFSTANRGYGTSGLVSYGTERFGAQLNVYGRQSNTIRTANGIDSHSAVTRFLGLPSTVLYDRAPDTEFSQYGGSLRFDYAVAEGRQLIAYYQRGQQDDGKRFDQLIGGDGNLVANLRNLMGDFAYVRFAASKLGYFDNGSFTASYNSQREERVNQGGQGNPFAGISHQYERTTATGFSFFLNKRIQPEINFLLGGDFYHERINSPAFTFDPLNNAFFLSRPRIPDEGRFDSGGLFFQGSWQAIPNRLRLSGAVRYSAADYQTRALDSPLVNGNRLWQDDNLNFGDISGRFGAVFSITKELSADFNFSRGFRFPSMTDLGTLGLTGDGFEIDYLSAAGLGGTLGSDASSNASDTGIPVSRQRSEISRNFDLKLRYHSEKFETSATFFSLLLKDSIVKQALILPQGAIGQFLGDQQIVSQLPNGVVFVPLSSSPVLVRANFSDARLYGFEYDATARFGAGIEATAGFTYIRSEDTVTGEPPNIEGGTPPHNGFLGLSYRPADSRFWIEGVATMAARQDRLSSLDLGDRRTGATRSRSQIANFFQRGACVRGLTNNPDGVCGTGDETILLLTGESLSAVQNRVLGNAQSAPLFTSLPGYLVIKIRGGFNVGKNSTIYWAAENIFDQFHRNPSWGIDGIGRGFRVGYRLNF